MAVAARMPDQAALPPRLLPAPEPDRAALGRDAQEYHPQQDLWHLQGVCRSDSEFPERQRPPKLGQISQHSHRQFSRDIAEGFSGYRVNRVYHNGIPCERWLRALVNRVDPQIFASCFEDWI